MDKLKASNELEGGLKKGRTYAVIFSNNIGNQTYDLYFDLSCIGDIVVCNGETQSNPVSPGKYCAIAEWKDNSEFDSVVYEKTPPSDQKPAKVNVNDESSLSKEMGFAVIVIVASVVLLLALAFVITSAIKKRKIKEE